MKRSISLLAILILILVLVVAGAQAKSVNLEHKFTKGQVVNYRMSIDISARMPDSAGGAPLPISAKMSAITKQKVLEVMQDGSAKVQISLHDLKMSMPGMPERVIDNAAGQAVTMVMTKHGKVLSIDGLSGITAGAGIPGADFGQMMGQIGAYGGFPGKPVEVGEKWSQAVPLPFGGGEMQVDSELLAAAVPVRGTTGSKLKQTFNGHMNLGELMKGISGSVQTNPSAQQAMSSLTGGADLKGWSVFYFSPTGGGLIKANGNTTVDFKMNLPASAASSGVPAQMDMVIDMKVDIARTN